MNETERLQAATDDARALLSEVRGALKDMTQVLREAREVRATLVDELVRETIGERIEYHLQVVAEASSAAVIKYTAAVQQQSNKVFDQLAKVERMIAPIVAAADTDTGPGFFARKGGPK